MDELVITNRINLESFTPIEIALGIDEEGKTTARKLYKFLELNSANYAKWVKTNITNNRFAEENVDFSPLIPKEECSRINGQFAQDYKLTASFAKKLAMVSHSLKGEIAREYFVKVEDKLKQIMESRFQFTITREIGKALRRELTDALQDSGLNDKMHGHGYSTFTDLIYKLVLGMTAKKYREVMGLPIGANVRENINQYQLHEIGRLEKAAQSMIDIGMDYEEIKRILSEKFLKQLN